MRSARSEIALSRLLLLAVGLVSSAVACASPTPQAPPAEPARARTEALLPRLHRAALDFLAAREAGDALGMAHAAAARRELDDARVRLGDAQRLGALLGADEMLAEARAVARGDAATLAEIARIGAARQESWVDTLSEESLFGTLGALLDPERLPEDLVAPPVSAPLVLPLRLAPGAAETWRVRVEAQATLWLYVTRGDGLVLKLLDAEAAEQFFVGAAQRGEILCDPWRPGRAAVGIVEVTNASSDEATGSLLVHWE